MARPDSTPSKCGLVPEAVAEALGITVFELFTRALLFHTHVAGEYGLDAYSPRAVSIAYARYQRSGTMPAWLVTYLVEACS